MMDDPLQDPNLQAFETQLFHRLPPIASVEKDQLLYACGMAAGQQLVSRSLRVWQSVSVVLGLALLGLTIPHLGMQRPTDSSALQQTAPVVASQSEPPQDLPPSLLNKPILINLDAWQVPPSSQVLHDPIAQLQKTDPHLQSLTVAAMTRLALKP